MADVSGARTVLVVEDDHEIREAIAEVLSDEGYRIVSASNGREALDELRRAQDLGERPPGLILLDLMMPILDGASFRRALLQEGKLAEIPVVILTAQPTASASLPSVAAALQKPIRLKELMQTVERFYA